MELPPACRVTQPRTCPLGAMLSSFRRPFIGLRSYSPAVICWSTLHYKKARGVARQNRDTPLVQDLRQSGLLVDWFHRHRDDVAVKLFPVRHSHLELNRYGVAEGDRPGYAHLHRVDTRS